MLLHVGQFWNTPVDISPYYETTPEGAEKYSINITVGDTHRNYVGELLDRTWDGMEEACLSVRNSQGGPIGQDYSYNDAVIEGNYKNYRVNEVFSEVNYAFGLFREDICNTGSASGSGSEYLY